MNRIVALMFMVIVIASSFLTTVAVSQTAEERAGELKNWREQCGHPDPDLRLAYLEQALETKDASIERICIRLALRSDNADIRNLGLRAAIASFEELTFDVSMPHQLAKAIEKAEDDEDRLKEIRDWYITRDYNTIQNGMAFAIDGANVSSAVSKWFALGSLSSANKNYKGKATIVGDRVRWIGKAYLKRDWNCTLDVGLNQTGELEGSLQCADLWPIPLRAPLL